MGRGGAEYDSCSSFMSSELESTSCFDSEDDDATSRSEVLSNSSVCYSKLKAKPFGLTDTSKGSWIWAGPVECNSIVVLVVTPWVLFQFCR